jgi:tetratricopeptide (TPR) repeat protein
MIRPFEPGPRSQRPTEISSAKPIVPRSAHRGRPSRGGAFVYWIIIVLAVCVGIGAFAWIKVTRWVNDAEASVRPPEVIGVRPEPPDVPSERPFVGGDGEDAYGYPLRTADRTALLHLLRLGMFEELEKYSVEYQKDFEADPRKEYWPIDAFESFDNADPSLGPLLDEWVEKRPASWAPWLARGSYRAALGWFHRGEKKSLETSWGQSAAMRREFEAARSDLRKALELEPKLIAAHRQLIIMGTTSLDMDERVRNLEAALAVCPTCFQVRVAHIYGLRPIWGGSFQEMDEFAASAQTHADQNPRLRLLAGYVALERCRSSANEKKLEEAAAHCAELAPHAHWEFEMQRARLFLFQKKYGEALELLDRAVAQRPQDLNLLRDRTWALEGLDRWEELGETTLAIRRQDVTDPQRAEIASHAIEVLLWAVGRESSARRFDEARKLVNLVLAIHPGHPQAKQLLLGLGAVQAH